MKKPFTMVVNELRENFERDINDSQLHPTIVKMILVDLLRAVEEVEKRQLDLEAQAFDETESEKEE